MSNKKDEHGDAGQKPVVPQPDVPMSVFERNRGKFDFVLMEHDVVEANTKLIAQLHNDVIGYLTTGLEKAFQIGELLFELKKRIRHSFFTRWATEHLPIKLRTAQNYMRLYRYKDELVRRKTAVRYQSFS